MQSSSGSKCWRYLYTLVCYTQAPFRKQLELPLGSEKFEVISPALTLPLFHNLLKRVLVSEYGLPA